MRQQCCKKVDISECYQSERQMCSFILFIFTVLATFSFSLLQQHFTNIYIAREAVVISVASLIYYFDNQKQDEEMEDVFYQRRRTENMGLIVISAIVFFQAPGYPVISLLFLYLHINYPRQQPEEEGTRWGIIFFLRILFLAFISFCLFAQYQILRIPPKILFFLPLLLIVSIFLFLLVNFIEALCERKRGQKNFIQSRDWKFLVLYQTLGVITLTNLFAALANIYLTDRQELVVVGVAFLADLAVVIIYLFFRDCLIIYSIFPEMFDGQLMFRVQHRRFASSSQEPQNRQREIEWNDQECLLCSSPATVVNFKCGHLTLCPACHSKYLKKEMFACFICLKQSNALVHYDMNQKLILFTCANIPLKQIQLPRNFAFKNAIQTQ